MQSVSGDEFIGAAAPGHPEPAFNDGGADGTTYQIASANGTSITLSSTLTRFELTCAPVWANSQPL